jgi:hypothetical protein
MRYTCFLIATFLLGGCFPFPAENPTVFTPKYKLGDEITYLVPPFLENICSGEGTIVGLDCGGFKPTADFRCHFFDDTNHIAYEVKTPWKEQGCPDLLVQEKDILSRTVHVE